jgi:4-amino-4-deoxy-L-arabinose transferase-like glycosyltransferase
MYLIYLTPRLTFKLSAICENQQVLFIGNNQSVSNKKTWIFDLLGLAILLGFFYALWIGSHPLFTPDEGRYSEVAREMVVSGDYVTPRLNGVAFLDKPALYYWLQASAIKVFGLTEGALRFWPAVLGILSMLITYMTGRLLFSRRAGWMSAIILATSPLYYGGAHYANLDLEVASLVADSLLCFIAAIEGSLPRLKTLLLLAAYTFAGLAALTKGLIGIAFPAMIIGAWILLLNRWNILTKMRLFTGLVIFVLIAAPWYVLVQQANPEFLHFFFVTQQVSRFLTTQDFNSKAVVWFYVPVVLAGFFPWTIFLVQAIAQKCQLVWQNRQEHAVSLYLLLWFVIVLVFFSIPRSKTVGYILPIFPVMALLVGSYLDSVWDNAKARGVRAASVAFMVLGCILSIAFLVLPYFNSFLEAPLHFLHYVRYMGVAIAVAVVAVYSLRHKSRLAPLFSCLTATIAVLLLIFIFSATTINEKTIKPLAMQLKSQLQPDDEVIAFYKYYQDLPIYLERRITIVADWHASDIPHKDNWLREMWYGMVFQDTKNWLIEEDAFWKRWNSDKRLYVVTDEDYYKDLKAKTTVYKIGQVRDVVLLSNKA